MKIIPAIYVAFAVGLLSCPTVSEAEDDIPTIIRANVEKLARIRSAWCAFTREGTNEGKFVKIATGECGVRPDALFYDYIQEDDQGELKGVVTWSERFTWNGKQACDFLRYPDRSLALYNDWFASPVTETSTVFLDAFDFLLGNRDTRGGSCLMLSQLASASEWEEWARSAKIIGREKLAVGECVIVGCAGRTVALDGSHGPYTMRVWFDAGHDYYPVQWERISLEGKCLERFAVTSLGYLDEKGTIAYPKVSETTWNGSNPARTTVTAVKNDVELADDQFKINPALAERVWDDATKKNIKMGPSLPTARDLWYRR